MDAGSQETGINDMIDPADLNEKVTAINAESVNVTVIIPFYNGKCYLASLFDMISQQHVFALEVLFVDDGSSDGSGELLEKKIQTMPKHEGILWKRIVQKNGGQGSARNTGLKYARGKWITFIDQDDRIPENYLSTLYIAAEEADCDVVYSGHVCSNEQGHVIARYHLQQTSWSRFRFISPWAKLYRTEFLVSHDIRFLTSSFGEDIYFTLLLEVSMPRRRYLTYAGYDWVQNQESVSHTVHRRLDRSACVLSVLKAAEGKLSSEFLSDREVQYFLLKTSVYQILYLAESEDRTVLLDYRADLIDYLKELCPHILHKPYVFLPGPKGEERGIRAVVAVYLLSYLKGKDDVFLSMHKTLSGLKEHRRLRQDK